MGPGQVIGGRYRLLAPLGEGGMSIVWRAADEVLGRMVAVKVLGHEPGADAAARAIVLAEAQAAARISHPHVAGVFDYGEWISPDGQAVPYVVMELLSGPSLAQRLDSGPLEPRSALAVAAEIAAGLAAAHSAGLVHRDVKPGNVILSPAGAKVVDFGIAAVVGEPDGLEADGLVLGTPSYLPPERVRRAVAVPASDMYAWGVLLHRMLTGRLPWPPDATLLDRVEHVQRADPLPGVSADIDGLFHRCLATEPGERPSAREAARITAVAAGLRPAWGIVVGDGRGLAEDEPTAPVFPRPLPRTARRHGGRVAVVTAVPAVTAAVLLALAYGPGSTAGLDPRPAGPVQLPAVGSTGSVSVTPGPVPSVVPPATTPSHTSRPGGAMINPPGPGLPVPTFPGIPPTPTRTTAPPTRTTPPTTLPPTTPPPTTGSPSASVTTPSTTPSPSPTLTSPPPGPVTLWSPGGTVSASCQGDVVTVHSASPEAGYVLHGGLPEPGTLVEVRFRIEEDTSLEDLSLDDDEVRISIWCVNGVPDSSYD